jgi:hypothetical protein
MGLLNPAALYLFAIVPALVIAYLARERPYQVTVSSVLAFRALRVMRGERFGGRPRFSWPFFLELLMLTLAVLAMAGPYLVRHGNPIAVVLDNSAPMQARMADGKTRFATAIVKLKEALGDENSDTTVTVYLTAPEPHPLGAPFRSPGAAGAAFDHVAAVDAPGSAAAFASLLNQLAADHKIARVIVVSYRPITSAPASRITAIALGEPIPNFAIGSFALARDSLGAATLHGRLAVANFSGSAQTLKAVITIDGKSATDAQATVAPGDVANLDFPNLPPGQVYHAHLDPTDAFPLDNEAFATASGVKNIAMLLVSPTVSDSDGLKSIPGVAVTARTPDAYSPNDLANSDIAIFEYTLPKDLPPANALFIMPPPGDALFNFATAQAAQLQVTGWSTTDPLTDGVNFRLLNIRSGEYFGQHPWMQAVVAGAGGGLILAGDRQDHRYIATGFNPLPYLGKQNLPMSILTLNLLSHLAGLGAPDTGYRTGEPWIVPAGVRAIVTPGGSRIAIAGGEPFSGANAQGIYRLAGADTTTLRAVNLADLTASDLENVTPLKIEAPVSGPVREAPPIRTPLTPYVIALIIALIALEALFVYRAPRQMLEVSA